MSNELKPYGKYRRANQVWLNNIPIHWKEAKSKRLFNETSIKNCRDEELLSATQNKGVIPRFMLKTRVVMPTGNLESFKLVKEGNFVISLRSFQGGLEYSKYRGLVSPAYNVLEEKIKQNKMYYKYLFKSHEFIGELQRNVTGIRQGKNIDVNDFKEIVLPIPSLDEQSKIVKYLDFQLAKINKFIKAKKKLILALKEQIECYVFGNENRNSTNKIISWDNAFPDNWLVVKSSRLTKEVNIKNSKESELIAVTQDRGVVYKKDCEQNYVSPSGDLSTLKLVRNGDFVISLRSFQGGIEFSEIEGIVSPAYNVFSLVEEYSSFEYKMFYKYIFKTKIFISELNTLVSGIRDGKNIHYSDFSKILVPIPPQKTVIKVCKLIEQYESIKKQFDNELTLLNEFKVSLISDVVTGKVDVRNIVIDAIQEDTEIDETDDEITDNEEDINIGESEQ